MSAYDINDFEREYRFRMVRAYPVISGVADAYEATHEEIDAGFLRLLDNRNLSATHELYLASARVSSEAGRPPAVEVADDLMGRAFGGTYRYGQRVDEATETGR